MTERTKLVFAVVDDVFRLVLGGVFIYAGWEKIQDPAFFATQVAAYRMLPDFCVGLFALVLPMVEALAGLSLIATRWPREAALLILGLLGMFFVGLTQGIVRDLKISCGCFGDGGADEGSLGAALRRDLVLLVPAVWLSLRPNRWLFRGVPFLLGALVMLVLAVFGWIYTVGATSPRGKFKHQAAKDIPAVTTAAKGDVFPERWTTNFPSALASARARHRPLILVVSKPDCRYCKLLEGTLKGTAFARWVKGTGIYLAETHMADTNTSVAQQLSIDFLKVLPSPTRLLYPSVAVYWPSAQTNDEVRLAFTGRHGLMPGRRHEALIGEFVNTLEARLSGYLKGVGKRPSLEEVIGHGVRRIRLREPEGGKVWMKPETGLLEQGAKVELFVKPNRGGTKIEWIDPDGNVIPYQRGMRLVVNDDMPAGEYSVRLTKLHSRKPDADGSYPPTAKKP